MIVELRERRDYKMINERKQQQEIGKSCNSITCECNSFGEEREKYVEEQDEVKNHDRTKLLIIFAVVMTVSIITLETFFHSVLSDYISLALATPLRAKCMVEIFNI